MSDTVKYLLEESRLPKEWYNIVADLPRPPDPVLHPGTLQPVGPADLEPLFPMALIAQEVAAERTIEIPEPIRQVYRQWRPSPLYRAHRLGRSLREPVAAHDVASPSDEPNAGRQILAQYPNSPGSLGIAISEAVEVAAQHTDTKYALGSVLNHVLLHQTVIGQEAIAQLEMAG